MTIWQLVGIIAGMIIIGGLLLCATRNEKAGVCTAIVGVIILLFACKIDTKQITKPTALDVCRGKSALELTYRDSVPTDTTVVYKVKEERK